MSRLLFLLFGVTCVLASAIVPSDIPGLLCQTGVAFRGARTESNLTPEEYFRAHKVGSRPRLVVMKGLPGSSKFSWSHAAEHFGWVVITLDEYRDRVIARKLLNGRQITIQGVPQTPNPLDPTHRMRVTWEASQWAKRDYEKALADGRAILWEGVFDQPRYRVPQFVAARRAGYTTECLSFDSEDVATNIANLEGRLFLGGRDLATLGLAADEAHRRRLSVLTIMQGRLQTFPLATRARTYRIFGTEPGRYDVRAADPFVAENDFVNRHEHVPVVRWENAMPPTAGVPWSVLSRRVILSPERFRNTELFRNGKKVKVVFLDADSTLRISLSGEVSANYGRDVMLLPGVAERIRRWNEEGALVAIISNQGGVPRHISLAEADAALRFTAEILRQAGARIDYIDFAEDGNPNRKPGPGMGLLLEEIIRQRIDPDATIDIASSIMVGDSAYTANETRPPEPARPGRPARPASPGTDFSNSDRRFAENFPGNGRHLTFVEPDSEEAFDWWGRFQIRRFDSAEQARALLLRLAAEAGRR